MKGKLDWKTFNLIPVWTTKDACFHLRTMEFTLCFVGLAAGLGLRLVLMGEKFIMFLQSCTYLMIIIYINPLAGPDAHVASRIVFFKGVSSAGIFVINLRIWMA